MKKFKTYRLISLTMALLIFFSSSGMSIDIHFCQGKVKRLNLFGKAKSCSEVSQELSNCHHGNNAVSSCGTDVTHDGCCNNQSFDLDLYFDSGEVTTLSLTDVQIKFVKAFVLNYLGHVLPPRTLQNYTNYYPPPLEQDITVLFQVFRL